METTLYNALEMMKNMIDCLLEKNEKEDKEHLSYELMRDGFPDRDISELSNVINEYQIRLNLEEDDVKNIMNVGNIVSEILTIHIHRCERIRNGVESVIDGAYYLVNTKDMNEKVIDEDEE